VKLSTHFMLSEFTESDTARRLGIDNSLPDALLPMAMATAQMMERVRRALCYRADAEIPILVTSGYRCEALNRAIGSTGRDHPLMLAVDFKAPVFGTPLQVCKALLPQMDALGIGQLIYEHTWVHVSSRKPEKTINRVLTLQGRAGYAAGIVEG
jgi:zinc D-Ala-D-Ala carboxypeptidase